MKIIVERDKLKDALAVVIGRTKGGPDIPILSHILMEAEGSTLKLTGHDLDSCSQVTIQAEVERGGSIAMPGDRFNRLVQGLPSGSQLNIDAAEKAAKVRCGRSIYQFMLLPAADFPAVMEPKEAVEFVLTGKQVSRLFKTPAPCISTDKNRFYLHGIYLHTIDGKLAGCATDGPTLVRTSVDLKPPKFDAVIVPTRACDQFVRIGGDEDEVRVEVSATLVAITAGTSRYVSKLIDGKFPTYLQVIPAKDVPAITVTAAEMGAALSRLVAACDPERSPILALSWDGEVEHLNASLHTTFGEGDEQIECDCQGREAGSIGLQVSYIERLIAALAGKNVRIYISGPERPVRLENPDDADMIAVCAPYQLPTPAAA